MVQQPVDVLSEIMRMWPRREEEWETARSRMNHLVTPELSFVDLAIRPIKEFRFSNALIVDRIAKIFVYDTGLVGDPGNLAIMVLGNDEQWRLKAFFDKCLVCFGYQLRADDVPCDYCGATGWAMWSQWQERFGDKW